MNIVLLGGMCSVFVFEGFVLEILFNVVCEGWLDLDVFFFYLIGRID